VTAGKRCKAEIADYTRGKFTQKLDIRWFPNGFSLFLRRDSADLGVKMHFAQRNEIPDLGLLSRFPSTSKLHRKIIPIPVIFTQLVQPR